MSFDAALEISCLRVSYGGVRALHDVSLTVPRGAVVALLGPNGAGKSTTLRTISGVMRAEEGGTITSFGRRIDRMAAYRIARMGVVHVPEGRGIFPSLDVRENLEMAAEGTTGRTNGQEGDRSALEEATEMFPVLGNRLRQTAGSLSGGEQQMLALARAIMARPRLLMVDEISMGLAPIVVGHLFEALRKIAATGASLLLVEQYVETALELADYVYVMDKGVIVDVGEPNDMRASNLAAAYLGGAA
ncbi:MAG TPA: ABC transporter ATP-binding protein [Acidimicrobiales bacterium]|nr:ABC transporter ATP-binding protein [Acidimicrobiales bacterium]